MPNGINGNKITLPLGTMWGIGTALIAIGIFVGVNVITTRNDVAEMKEEFKSTNKVVNEMAIKFAVFAANSKVCKCPAH